MASKATGRFQRFIDNANSKLKNLPLTHTTSAFSFADMCEEDNINPKKCKYFNEDLIYLFYGRPAYRTEKSEFSDLEFNWPIIFIFSPDAIKGITSVYPFDTGAFHINLYNRFFSKHSEIDHFKLPGSLDYAAKVAGTFYANEKEYLYGKSRKNIDISSFQFEAQGVQKLSQEPALSVRISDDSLTRDERSSAIEIQVNQAIDIKSSTLEIIMPQRYLELPEVVEALERWELAEENIHYYETMPFHEQAGWLPQIYKIVADVYEKRGFI